MGAMGCTRLLIAAVVLFMLVYSEHCTAGTALLALGLAEYLASAASTASAAPAKLGGGEKKWPDDEKKKIALESRTRVETIGGREVMALDAVLSDFDQGSVYVTKRHVLDNDIEVITLHKDEDFDTCVVALQSGGFGGPGRDKWDIRKYIVAGCKLVYFRTIKRLFHSDYIAGYAGYIEEFRRAHAAPNVIVTGISSGGHGALLLSNLIKCVCLVFNPVTFDPVDVGGSSFYIMRYREPVLNVGDTAAHPSLRGSKRFVLVSHSNVSDPDEKCADALQAGNIVGIQDAHIGFLPYSVHSMLACFSAKPCIKYIADNYDEIFKNPDKKIDAMIERVRLGDHGVKECFVAGLPVRWG